MRSTERKPFIRHVEQVYVGDLVKGRVVLRAMVA
jgi:hypothetical protein